MGNNGKNYLSAYGDFAFGLTSTKYEATDSDLAVNTITVDQEYTPMLNFEAGAEYFMELIEKDWFKVRARPRAYYYVRSDSYMKSEKTKNGTVTTDTYTADAIDSTVVNTFRTDFNIGAEMKPENWFLGFMVGTNVDLFLTMTSTKDNTAYVSDAPTANDDGIDKTVAYNWDSGMSNNFGIFIELPDNYRLDMNLNASDITQFEDFTVQLIVPLD
jgi:hypothetical protein